MTPRALVVFAFVALVFPLAGCGPSDEPPPGAEAPPEEPAADEGLQLSVGLDQASYAPGDSIRVVLRLANRLDTERTITFPTAQRFEVRILTDEGEEVVRWSESQAFAQVVGEETLPPETDGPEWTVWVPAPAEEGAYRIQALVPVNGTDLRAELPVRIEGA